MIWIGLAIFFIIVGILIVALSAEIQAQYKEKYEAYVKAEKSWRSEPEKPIAFGKAAFIPLVFAIICVVVSMVYAQDVGQVTVIRNWGGSLAGTSIDAGFHTKAPWQDVIKYDIRNNVLSFMGEEENDQFKGGSANGSHVTINDKGGASATIDIQVNYSLDPMAAEELYANYGTQENFVKSICAVDIRAVPREVSGKFDTISILTARGEFTNAVQEALTAKWKKYGLIVEQVSIQNVVYPESIVNSYAAAQSAEIAKAQALNEQETAKVKAETKIIEAQADAEANKLLSESLTPEVVQQHYIEALAKAGKLFVVPSDSMPIISME